VIKSAGYRIGPAGIEDCLLKHPTVPSAPVIGIADEHRGEAVKAYIVLTAGSVPSEELKEQIQAHVRTRLAPYQYPREIEFIDALPMTTTGKVQRRFLRELSRAAGTLIRLDRPHFSSVSRSPLREVRTTVPCETG
jgi:acetyl-CoA synthetase